MKIFMKAAFFIGLMSFLIAITVDAQQPELIVQSGHLSRINSLAFSPDGRLLVSGDNDGNIVFWDLAAGKVIRTFTEDFGEVTAAIFSPDGQTIVSSSGPGKQRIDLNTSTIKLWDVHTGEMLQVFGQYASSSPTGIAFSPEGQLAANFAGGSYEQSKFIRLWDARTGQEKRTFVFPSQFRTSIIPLQDSVTFSPNGWIVAGGNHEKTITLWDVQTGKELHTLRGHSEGINTIAFSPDGQLFASGSWDHTLKLWDPLTGEELRTLTGHAQGVTSIAFSPDGQHIVSGSQDNTIKLWDVKTGEELRTFQGHLSNVNVVAFNPAGTILASGSDDATIKLWDVESGQELGTLHSMRQQDWAVVTPEYLFDASPGAKQSMHWVLGLESMEFSQLKDYYSAPGLLAKLTGFNDEPVHGVSLPPELIRSFKKAVIDHETAAIITPELEHFYQPQTEIGDDQKPELVVQTGHAIGVLCAAFSSDKRLIATGGGDNTIKLWDVETGKELRTLAGHGDMVTAVMFSPDGRIVASGSFDTSLKFWDIQTGNELRTLLGHSEAIQSIAFSPNGRIVASGSTDSTIRLWDVKTGEALHALSGHAADVISLDFSPDGHLLASGSDDSTMKLWDVRSGRALRTLRGHTRSVFFIDFSPTGRLIASGGKDEMTKLWDIQTGKTLRTFGGSFVAFGPDRQSLITHQGDNFNVLDIRTAKVLRILSIPELASYASAVFSSDRWMIIAQNKSAELAIWDIKARKILHRLVEPKHEISSVAISHRGEMIASGYTNDTVRLLNLKTATLRTLPEYAGWSDFWIEKPLIFSPDGQFLAGTDVYGALRVWESQTGKVRYRFEGHTAPGMTTVPAAFSPDGQFLASGSDGQIKLWDMHTGQELLTFSGHEAMILSMAFSPDGEILLSRGDDNRIRLWDVTTGEKRGTLTTKGTVDTIAFSPDGKRLVSGGEDGVIIWDVHTGQQLRTLPTSPTSLAFSPDGQMIAGASSDPRPLINIWDVHTGNVLHRLTGHIGDWIHSIDFHPRGDILISGGYGDPRIKLWDVKKGAEIATLIFLDQDDWVVVTPNGQFDATPVAMKLMHFVVGLEPIELEQLKERYYEPGLLPKLFGFSDEPLREVPAFKNVKLYPEMEWIDDDLTDASVRLRLKNRGGGIGKVVVFINGKEVSADARGADTDPNAQELDVEIDLQDHPFLISGEQNTIEVKAWNAEGYLVSRGLILEHDLPKKHLEQVEVESPHLWAIVAGVSEYQGDALDLQFAAKDAEDMAQALQLGAKRLFGVEKVHLSLLTSPPPNLPHQGGGTSFPTPDPSQEENSSQTLPSPGGRGQGRGIALPTRKNLIQAFDAARNAKSTDVLVVYLAGHGVNHGGQDGDYYYLTADARTGTLDDPAVRAQTAISSQELTELIKQIPALKQVLILDTCMSGRVVEKLTEQRNIPSSQIRALERMKDRMGLHILAGSAADAVSYEASRYGQGLLTYSLLLGMRGAALREEEYVDISKLFEFAADQVPELAKDVGGIQRPVVATPRGGSSFDIGRLTSDDTPQIPLATVRPMILRVSFQDEVRILDHVGLTKRINAKLREVAARGRGAPLVFVDALEFPEAYTIGGRYRVEGDAVNVTVYVFYGEKSMEQFPVEGSLSDVDQLVQDIVGALEQTIEEFSMLE